MKSDLNIAIRFSGPKLSELELLKSESKILVEVQFTKSRHHS